MLTYASVVDPAFLSDAANHSLSSIRDARNVCGRAEAEFSYARRLVQGRLDIAQTERIRRAQGLAASDLSALVASLPTALAANAGSRPGGTNRHLNQPVGELVEFTDDEIDVRLLDPAALADLPEFSDERLGEVAAQLGALERSLSDRRRTAQDAFDLLSAELVRRYRTGEATIEAM